MRRQFGSGRGVCVPVTYHSSVFIALASVGFCYSQVSVKEKLKRGIKNEKWKFNQANFGSKGDDFLPRF